MARLELKPKAKQPKARRKNVPMLSTGSYLLDKVLGGGWAYGRVVNIVGDRSSGKTLLAIEACANFVIDGANKDIRYAEAEAAFDEDYAKSIGMPEDISYSKELATVEQWYDDLVAFIQPRAGSEGCLYVLDSLDALSDDAEMERDINKNSYGASKPKKISEMFRRQIAAIGKANCILFVISQIRDKMNVTFGETKTRSGGRALDFYASQILWIAEIGKIKRTVMGAERVVGVNVLARTKKNKVGMPFRDCELTIIFNYGVDDEISMLNWIKKNKAPGLSGTVEQVTKELIAARKATDRGTLQSIRKELRKVVDSHWNMIEAALEPPLKKYG